MQFDLIDSREGLAALGPEWEELEGRCAGHLFQSHRFLSSWYACAGRESNAALAVVACRDEGALRAVFPGCIISKGGVRILTWLGGFFVVDYGDVLFDPASSCGIDTFLEGALRLLRQKSRFQVCYFHNVRHDAAAYPYISRHFRTFRSDVAPYVQLEGDFEEYLNSLKRFRKKQKSDTLRQIKRLSELGQLEFGVLPAGDSRSEPLLEAFFAQKRWRFQISGVHGVLFQPGYEEFYRDQALHNDQVHLSYLSLDGAIIATHVGYLYRDRFYYLMPSYDHNFAGYSPGRVLTYYLIRECFDRGVKVFDFCFGRDDYKYEWTDSDVPETCFVSNNLGGRLFISVKKAKISLDNLVRKRRNLK